MKKCWILVCMMVFLSGCGAVQTFETVDDTPFLPAMGQMREILLTVPEDAASPVVNTESGAKLYLCDGYELTLQTLDGGDLEKTVQSVSGFSVDQLTLVETSAEPGKRYDWVWTAMGEGGEQIGRAAVVDDGSYHYCVSVMARAEDAGTLEGQWNSLFATFSIS